MVEPIKEVRGHQWIGERPNGKFLFILSRPHIVLKRVLGGYRRDGI